MVELEPNSCRICLTMTQISARESLYLDDGLLSDAGLLYEQVLSLPIADEEYRLKYICNYCKLQLKSFKDFKARAWEVHLMLSDINDDISDGYDIENYPEIEFMENIKTEVIEDVNENDADFASEKETLIEIKEDTEEQVEEVQYIYEENTVEDGDEVQDEEYLIEADHIKTQCNSSNNGKINMFSCSSCDETFKLKTHLIQHRKKTHPKTKKFSCPLCSKITFSKEALDVHLNVHNGLPAYQCEICGKTFKQKAHYNYHMLNHRNERNIICEVCSKAFISKSDLKIHMRAHTDERRYKCDICEKTFRAHTHMVNHRYSHFEKQFECPACFQKYVSPNTLRTHFKAVHMGEVPYECEICEKKFKRKHHLHAHYKTHNKIMAIQNETEESSFAEIQNEQ